MLPALLIALGLYLSYLKRESIRDPNEFSEQTRVYFDGLAYMPVIALGYVFGVLGGLFRGAMQVLRGEQTLELRLMALQISVGGIIGIIATLAIEHSLINLFVFAPDATKLSLTFNGTALISFFAAFFSIEIMDRARNSIAPKEKRQPDNDSRD